MVDSQCGRSTTSHAYLTPVMGWQERKAAFRKYIQGLNDVARKCGLGSDTLTLGTANEEDARKLEKKLMLRTHPDKKGEQGQLKV